MSLTHVGVQLVSVKEAFPAKFTEGMNSALNLFLGNSFVMSTHVDRGHMGTKLGVRVQGVFMGKDFFCSDTYIAISPSES